MQCISPGDRNINYPDTITPVRGPEEERKHFVKYIFSQVVLKRVCESMSPTVQHTTFESRSVDVSILVLS